MFLLDTNVVSELRKAGDGKADPNVVAWLSGIAATEFYVSSITLMELELGILRVERRDPSQGARLRTWMNRHVLPEFAEQTLPVDAAVALRCARLHVPDPRFGRDAYIAATAPGARHDRGNPERGRFCADGCSDPESMGCTAVNAGLMGLFSGVGLTCMLSGACVLGTAPSTGAPETAADEGRDGSAHRAGLKQSRHDVPGLVTRAAAC